MTVLGFYLLSLQNTQKLGIVSSLEQKAIKSLGDNVILGMNTHVPILVPVIIFASITHVANFVIINLVPLQSPSLWFKFLSNIIGKPIFNVNL